MTGEHESSACEQDPLLLSRVEEGLSLTDDPSNPEGPRRTHDNAIGDPTLSSHDGAMTTTERILTYADNVTEIIAEVAYDMAGEVQQVVIDVAEDLHHTLEGMVTTDEVPMDESETVLLAVARTASFLPGDVARTPATAEPIFHHRPQQYQTFETETASISDSLTEADSLLFRGNSVDSIGSRHGKDKFVLEDPKDLVGISNDTTLKGKNQKQTTESESTPVAAYLLLAAAVLGLSSIGPLLNVQSGVDDTIKTLWRNSATTLALLPMALHSLVVDGLPSLSTSQIIVLLLSGACYAAYTVLFAWSVEYTTIGNAVIFSNSQAIILLVGKTIMGEPLSWAEALGSLTAFSGAVLCSRDSAHGENDDVISESSSLLGDGFAILCAVCGVGYLVTAKTVRPTMNLYVFMCCVMFWASVGSLFLAYLAGVHVTIDRHVDHGAFGWLNLQSDRLPLELIMVLSCQFLGALGYIRCMHYFSNLVISVATLMEPVVAELTAVALGVGALPGWMGWAGNGLVIAGTLAVVYRPSSLPTKEVAH